jgi:hypothetical protein
MTAQLLARAVAMSANPLPQPFHLGDELIA